MHYIVASCCISVQILIALNTSRPGCQCHAVSITQRNWRKWISPLSNLRRKSPATTPALLETKQKRTNFPRTHLNPRPMDRMELTYLPTLNSVRQFFAKWSRTASLWKRCFRFQSGSTTLEACFQSVLWKRALEACFGSVLWKRIRSNQQ